MVQQEGSHDPAHPECHGEKIYLGERILEVRKVIPACRQSASAITNWFISFLRRSLWIDSLLTDSSVTLFASSALSVDFCISFAEIIIRELLFACSSLASFIFLIITEILSVDFPMNDPTVLCSRVELRTWEFRLFIFSVAAIIMSAPRPC